MLFVCEDGTKVDVDKRVVAASYFLRELATDPNDTKETFVYGVDSKLFAKSMKILKTIVDNPMPDTQELTEPEKQKPFEKEFFVGMSFIELFDMFEFATRLGCDWASPEIQAAKYEVKLDAKGKAIEYVPLDRFSDLIACQMATFAKNKKCADLFKMIPEYAQVIVTRNHPDLQETIAVTDKRYGMF